MRRSRMLRSTAVAAATALAVAGCGLGPDPVVSDEAAVLDALSALHDGAEARATVQLELDQDELREVLAGDAEARALVGEALGDVDAEDADALLADLEEVRTALADHAVLLATGADGSARIAAEHRSEVWADLRVGGGLVPGHAPTGDGLRVDLQLQVDWATAAEVLDQPDLLGDLDEAAAQIAPFLGQLPELAAVEELLLALLGGELVGIAGQVDPDLLGWLGLSERELAAATDPDAALGELDLDLRELTGTALTFGGYRTDGPATLVDVTLELGEVAEVVLDELSADPGAVGMSFDEVEEVRAELARLPDRLVDVATLRLDQEGALDQVRVDLLDTAAQLLQAAEPDDADLATAQRVLGQLERTGLFLQVDVESIGRTTTVLTDPSTTVTPDELTAVFGALLLGGLGGGFDPGALDLPADGETSGSLDLDRSEQP